MKGIIAANSDRKINQRLKSIFRIFCFFSTCSYKTTEKSSEANVGFYSETPGEGTLWSSGVLLSLLTIKKHTTANLPGKGHLDAQDGVARGGGRVFLPGNLPDSSLYTLNQAILYLITISFVIIKC